MRIFLHKKFLYGNKPEWTYPKKIPTIFSSLGKYTGLTYNGSSFIAVSSGGETAISSDGISWNTLSNSYNLRGKLWKISYGQLDYSVCLMALGNDDIMHEVGNQYYYYTSASFDGGTNWQTPSQRSFGEASFREHLIAYGNNTFLAVTYDEIERKYKLNYASHSYDRWHPLYPNNTNLDGKLWTGLAYFNSKFALVDSEGYMSVCNYIEIEPSMGYCSWSQPFKINNLGISNAYKSLCTNGTKMFSVSANGYWSETSDGENWTKEVRGDNLVYGNTGWCACACNNSILVALHSDGYISTKRI